MKCLNGLNRVFKILSQKKDTQLENYIAYLYTIIFVFQDRKLKEKEKKREELKQLKAFKRKEILDKIEKLRKITGNEELAFKDEDLEEDFDPEKYDERMKEVFDQYDSAPVNPEDEEKPVFSDLDSDLDIENW